MASNIGDVKNTDEAADHQTDVTVTRNSYQPSPEIKTSILVFPPELMIMIFNHLSGQDKVSAACVCSYWHGIIYLPCLWKDFCPIVNVANLTDEHFELMRSREIREVKINYFNSWKSPEALLKALPCLQKLSLNYPKFLPLFQFGGNTFPGIKHLTISYKGTYQFSLHSFLKPMADLQHLRLMCIPSEFIFYDLIMNSKNLISLYIKCCEGVAKLIVFSVINISPIPSLKELVLEQVTMGDLGLCLISTAFPQLHTLEVMLSPDVTSKGLEWLAKLKKLKKLRMTSEHFLYDCMTRLDIEMSQLENLSLHGCRTISRECLKSISKLPLCSLRVPIADIELEAMQVLSKGCTLLQTLCLVDGRSSINHSLHMVKNLERLQELILENCGVNDDFWRENCLVFNNLKRLCLTKCQPLSEHCLLYLSQMASLEELSITKCMTANNEGMGPPGEIGKFKALTSLNLTEFGIKDEQLVELLKKTPYLTRLKIVSCNSVTENGLVAAVSNLKKLKTLTKNNSVEIRHKQA